MHMERKKHTGRSKKISLELDIRIRREVRKSSSQSSNQFKEHTDAQYSSRKVRRHFRADGFKKLNRFQQPRLLQRHKIVRFEFARNHQISNVKKWKNVLFSDEIFFFINFL